MTNKYSEFALNILTAMNYRFSYTKKDGSMGYRKEKEWIIQNIAKINNEFDIIACINNNSNKEKETNIDEFLTKRKEIQSKLDYLIDRNYCSGVIVFGDKNFPKLKDTIPLKEIPLCLFYKGNLDLIYENGIAVIGHLNPSNEIKNLEEQIVDELCNNNITVISGLALGCDSIAHKQTLKNCGKTIAILPNSLDNILPNENKELAQNIVENQGLLITEYLEPVFFTNKFEFIGRFIERDRLQAIFSNGVILSASYDENDTDKNGKKCDSGSRHAMNKAKTYRINRAVIYSEELLNNLENKNELNLNKKLSKEKDVFIINKHNIKSIITQMLNLKKQEYKKQEQCGFDF